MRSRPVRRLALPPAVDPEVPPPAGRLLAADPPLAVPDDPDDPVRDVAVDPVLVPDVVGARRDSPRGVCGTDGTTMGAAPDGPALPEELDPDDDPPEDDPPDEEPPDDVDPPPRGTACPPDDPDDPDDEEPPRWVAWAKAKAGTARAAATAKLTTRRVDLAMAYSCESREGIRPLPMVQLYCQSGRP